MLRTPGDAEATFRGPNESKVSLRVACHGKVNRKSSSGVDFVRFSRAAQNYAAGENLTRSDGDEGAWKRDYRPELSRFARKE
jgi:hypothetical protein